MHGPPGVHWGPPVAGGPRPAGIGRIWLVLAVAVLAAALTISIVLAVTSG
jgi:hypothetical protein